MYYMEQVDALFSFSGNVSYLQENLPYVDKVMGYLKSLSAEDALPCFPKGLMALFPPGVDWNDWQDSRAYGATTNFATWYVRSLRRFAALHFEFGSKSKSAEYTATANKVPDPQPADLLSWLRSALLANCSMQLHVFTLRLSELRDIMQHIMMLMVQRH